MQFIDSRNCCQNCEYLRIDNFCLSKGKYILSKNTSKTRDCPLFSCKNLQLSEDIKEIKATGARDIKEILLQVQNNSDTNSMRQDSAEKK
jgi:hypothetical protein